VATKSFSCDVSEKMIWQPLNHFLKIILRDNLATAMSIYHDHNEKTFWGQSNCFLLMVLI